ncbi:hypothetical protein ACFVT5_16530 [Streptomyces sp. NPDC058001]|uniref:hypothetical protein n=1 Tax=Streptomyces sp. NPDC058001 TaxID=3346300 RepID=UPI0036E209ED
MTVKTPLTCGNITVVSRAVGSAGGADRRPTLPAARPVRVGTLPGMPPRRFPRTASRPVSAVLPRWARGGALRGVGAGVLAVLAVSLPLLGHALSRCHAPAWIIAVAMAAVAVPSAVALTRRRLTEAQAVGALAAAQVACHAGYALPGACHAVTGHLVALVIAARLLGVTERLLWRSRPLLTAVKRLLAALRPLLRGAPALKRGPERGVRESMSPLRSALLVRRQAGRAPPGGGRRPVPVLRSRQLRDLRQLRRFQHLQHLWYFRPMSTGGRCLA